eukprot:4465280-Pyramimonas_sp.AAC.1
MIWWWILFNIAFRNSFLGHEPFYYDVAQIYLTVRFALYDDLIPLRLPRTPLGRNVFTSLRSCERLLLRGCEGGGALIRVFAGLRRTSTPHLKWAQEQRICFIQLLLHGLRFGLKVPQLCLHRLPTRSLACDSHLQLRQKERDVRAVIAPQNARCEQNTTPIDSLNYPLPKRNLTSNTRLSASRVPNDHPLQEGSHGAGNHQP